MRCIKCQKSFKKLYYSDRICCKCAGTINKPNMGRKADIMNEKFPKHKTAICDKNFQLYNKLSKIIRGKEANPNKVFAQQWRLKQVDT